MNWKATYLGLLLLWMTLASLCGQAQVRGRANAMPGVDAQGNPQTVEAALHLMSDQAAIIFVGTVAGVDRQGADSGIVEIHFTIEQAVRGCATGAYTMREWAGLWTANDSRYRVGQHLLVFLHAPGPSGLTSPVGGLDGAIPLRASGSGITASDKTTASSEPVADLRWIGAKLVRTIRYRAPAPPPASIARPMLATSSEPALTTPDVSDSSAPAQESSVTSLITMLRSWKEANDATR